MAASSLSSTPTPTWKEPMSDSRGRRREKTRRRHQPRPFEDLLEEMQERAAEMQAEMHEQAEELRGRSLENLQGAVITRSDRDPDRRRDRHARRRRRAEKRELTPEERAYKEAKEAANARIGFIAHLIPYLAVNLLVLVAGGFRPFFFCALGWGIGLAAHYFSAMVAPRMRKRIIEQEVSARVHADVSRERRSQQTEQAKRIEELSASIAHEIRNPITAAKSLVQQMGEDPGARENVEYASVALDELQRVERSVSHLLRFAREEDIEIRDVSMGDVVESAIDTFRDRLEALGVEVERDVQAPGSMRGDPDQLRRVIINLVGNALDAFDEFGTADPRIQVQAGENLAGTEVWVRVRDNGPGMDPDRLQKIFTPFYTSKESGTGLGLAISKKVVDAHG